MRILCAAIILTLIGMPFSTANADSSERPRVGLVLGGGGAKGVAHVGILKVLEEYRIPVDAISGTSMGSIVGALYATGRSADEIEGIAREIDWIGIFDDETDRSDINFRRKQDDFSFLTKFNISIQDGNLVLPEGLIQGQKLFLELSKQFADVSAVTDFDDLPIPYRAVAADFETGDAVALGDGDLVTAVFSSMAVPGAIPPVERDGLFLIDGGIANNVPIDVARAMGVDIVIAVNVGTRLKTRDEVNSFLDVFNQLSIILGTKNTERQLASLTNQDILIEPNLGGMGMASFGEATNAIEPGIQAAESVANRLQVLSLSEAEWEHHLASRQARRTQPPIIEFVRMEQDSKLSDSVVEEFIEVETGRPVDNVALNQDVAALYGLDTFRRISYSVLTEDGRSGLVITANENQATNDFFRFGLRLESDFDSDAQFELGASYTKRNVNQFGGEWRTFLQVGDNLGLGTEFYQPFGSKLNLFVNPSAILFRGNSLLFEGGPTPIADVRISAAEIGLDGGALLGNWGELRVGVHRAWGDVKPRIGNPTFGALNIDNGYYFTRLDVDTLDSLSFPTKGRFLRTQWTGHIDELGTDATYKEFEITTVNAISEGRNTLLLGGKFQTTIDAEPGALAGYNLGGFLNLSGFAPDQLSGRHVAYGQAIYYRRLTDRGPFLDIPLYIGGSVEAGNVYDDLDDVSVSSLTWSGSLFVGVNSPIGPVYLGGGLAEGGSTAAYLFVGQYF